MMILSYNFKAQQYIIQKKCHQNVVKTEVEGSSEPGIITLIDSDTSLSKKLWVLHFGKLP